MLSYEYWTLSTYHLIELPVREIAYVWNPAASELDELKIPPKEACAIRISPMHRAKVFKWVLALHLHDVDLPVGGPLLVDTQGPPGRPDAAADIDPALHLKPAVLPDMLPLCDKTGRSILYIGAFFSPVIAA